MERHVQKQRDFGAASPHPGVAGMVWPGHKTASGGWEAPESCGSLVPTCPLSQKPLCVCVEETASTQDKDLGPSCEPRKTPERQKGAVRDQDGDRAARGAGGAVGFLEKHGDSIRKDRVPEHGAPQQVTQSEVRSERQRLSSALSEATRAQRPLVCGHFGTCPHTK